ncbi:MAG TPA: hypothetical protein VKU61_11055 [Candidatus Binatia bacterium]|nr:hypothetical protein [Candidatus Binatia bacterium]
MPRPPVKWPGAEREDRTPFERFRELLGEVIHVPKERITERASDEVRSKGTAKRRRK